ncbi:L-serine ammonia-lyase, iron-sulfur-dependent subunit beta [Lachnospiraceae bacterium 42-17]|jgi:L-serine dehydratase|nr:L-serine ammonia-lyase, iron-sulfur-dependent, subunit beta [Dorea sp.]
MANIFDILGPVMVGPSSSHTAGAVRIGLIARQLFGRQPDKAEVYLHGSFAATGKGHGTDKALVAGLLGMKPDDLRIPESFDVAKEMGMEFVIEPKELRDAHPNTAKIIMEAEDGKRLEIQAFSIGGGRIRVSMLDGMEVNFSGETNTLIVRNQDQPGCITDVSTVLNLCRINIATMQVFRARRGGSAVMVVETDQVVPKSAIEMLEGREGIMKVTFLNVSEKE